MKAKLAFLLAFLVTHFFIAAGAAEVVIPDTALKAAIWQALGRSEPVGLLTEQDMLSLTNLYANSRGITCLVGLGAAQNLISLELYNNQLTRLTLPSGLTNLTTLRLWNNQLTSLTLPAGITSLTTLDLSHNHLADLTLPAGLTRLSALELFANRLTDFSFLSDLTGLTTLGLQDNRLMSLTLPASLTRLTNLCLVGNGLTNLTLPPGLTSLATLDLSFSTAPTFTLSGDGSHLTSLGLHGYYGGDFLQLNPLTSLTLPSGLTNLTALDLHANELTSLALSAGLTSLTTLDLRFNSLTSLTLPADLTNLTTLDLRNNPLQSFVVSEQLAVGALAELVAGVRNQGLSITIYMPTLRLAALPRAMGGTFEVLLTGPPGTYRLQVTRDFSNWTELDPVTFDANGSVKVSDPSANARTHSFYRAVR